MLSTNVLYTVLVGLIAALILFVRSETPVGPREAEKERERQARALAEAELESDEENEEARRQVASSTGVMRFCLACEKGEMTEAGRKGFKVLKCRGCWGAVYCSTACSKADWPQHQVLCGGLPPTLPSLSRYPLPDPLLPSTPPPISPTFAYEFFTYLSTVAWEFRPFLQLAFQLDSASSTVHKTSTVLLTFVHSPLSPSARTRFQLLSTSPLLPQLAFLLAQTPDGAGPPDSSLSQGGLHAHPDLKDQPSEYTAYTFYSCRLVSPLPSGSGWQLHGAPITIPIRLEQRPPGLNARPFPRSDSGWGEGLKAQLKGPAPGGRKEFAQGFLEWVGREDEGWRRALMLWKLLRGEGKGYPELGEKEREAVRKELGKWEEGRRRVRK